MSKSSSYGTNRCTHTVLTDVIASRTKNISDSYTLIKVKVSAPRPRQKSRFPETKLYPSIYHCRSGEL